MRFLLFSLSIVSTHFCFGQNFEPTDSCVVHANVKYELNYYLSGGNLNSIRVLTDGVLLKHIKKNGKSKIRFIKKGNLDYYTFLKMQLYIDSILWRDSSVVSEIGEIPVFGLPETLQILRIEDAESRVYFLKQTNSEVLKGLVSMLNSYIPRKYRDEFHITVGGISTGQ
jgi:hypothetical protein